MESTEVKALLKAKAEYLRKFNETKKKAEAIKKRVRVEYPSDDEEQQHQHTKKNKKVEEEIVAPKWSKNGKNKYNLKGWKG